jgi:hypothetical protein
MKTKIFLTLALCLSIITTTAFAQGKGKGKGKGNAEMRNRPAEERATAHTNHLEKKLGLSAEQKTQVYEINLATAKKNDEIRAKRQAGGADNKALSVERKENEKNRVAKIEALLTADQKTKWEAWKAAKKARVEARKMNKGKGGKGKSSDEDLEEDDED